MLLRHVSWRGRGRIGHNVLFQLQSDGKEQEEHQEKQDVKGEKSAQNELAVRLKISFLLFVSPVGQTSVVAKYENHLLLSRLLC